MAKTVKKTTKKKKTAKKTVTKKATAKKTAKKATKKVSKKSSAKKASVKKTAKKAAKKSVAKKAVKKKAVAKKTAKKKAVAKKTPAKRTRKRKSYLTAKELEFFKDILIIKRRELIGDVNLIENEALKKSRLDAGGDLSSMPIHMADMGTDNFEQEFSLHLMDGERKILHEINLALNRMVAGKYGVCEGTGKKISKARLEANPWAKYCIEYATMVEKGQVIEGERIIEGDDYGDDDYVNDDNDDSVTGFDLADYENMNGDEDDDY